MSPATVPSPWGSAESPHAATDAGRKHERGHQATTQEAIGREAGRCHPHGGSGPINPTPVTNRLGAMLASVALVPSRYAGLGARFRVGSVLVRRHGCRRRLADAGDRRPDACFGLAHGAARACLVQAALQTPDASDVRTGGSGLLARPAGQYAGPKPRSRSRAASEG